MKIHDNTNKYSIFIYLLNQIDLCFIIIAFKAFKYLFINILKVQKEMQTTNRKFFIDDGFDDQPVVKHKNTPGLVNRLSVLCLTTFYFGYCLVYISALGFNALVQAYGPTINQPYVKGLLIGCLTLGAALGSLFSIFLIPMASRRNLTLMLCFLSVIIQGVLQAPTIEALFICRTLQGVIVGIFMALIPQYISELAPKQLVQRNVFGVFATLFVIIGVMFAFSLSIILILSGLQDQIRYRIIFAVNFVAVVIVIVSILTGYIPQSPISLIKQRRQQQAKAVIAMFHRKRYVDQVYRQKLQQMERKKNPKASVVKDRPFLRSFLTFQIPMMQQLTGINAFVSQMGFVVTDYNTGFGQFVPVIMGIVQFIAAIYAMTCLAKTKRRSMILIGNFGMGICSLGIGILYQFEHQFPAGFWIVVVLTFIYMTIHGGTLIPAVWTYVPEISSGRQPDASSIINWLMCSATIIVFPIINQQYGFAPMFLTFGIISIVLFVLNYFIMFESKPQTIEQINYELKNSAN